MQKVNDSSRHVVVVVVVVVKVAVVAAAAVVASLVLHLVLFAVLVACRIDRLRFLVRRPIQDATPSILRDSRIHSKRPVRVLTVDRLSLRALWIGLVVVFHCVDTVAVVVVVNCWWWIVR